MDVNVKDLIERLAKYKEKVQDNLNEEDDLMLAVVLAVLKTINNDEELENE